MPKKVERASYAPEARQDLLEAVRWISKDSPSAARALRKAVDAAAVRIARYPEIGHLRPEIAEPPFRFLVLTGFPYLIFYNASRTPPRVLRIIHGARDLPDVLRDL